MGAGVGVGVGVGVRCEKQKKKDKDEELGVGAGVVHGALSVRAHACLCWVVQSVVVSAGSAVCIVLCGACGAVSRCVRWLCVGTVLS